MKRSQLEHVIRAAATIADDDEIVVVGSQSIRDRFFVRDAIRYGLVTELTLLDRLDRTAIDDELRQRIAAFVRADFGATSR